MSKLQKLQCDNCGGRIDGSTLTCQSCGMQFRLADDMTLRRIEIFHGHFQLLEGKIAVPAYVLSTSGPEDLCKMTLTQMAEAMVPKIIPFMELQTMFDPRTADIITLGRIRVAEPSRKLNTTTRELVSDFSSLRRI